MFGDLGSTVKKSLKKSHLKGKAFISFDFSNKSSASGGKPQHTPCISKCIQFRVDILVCIGFGVCYLTPVKTQLLQYNLTREFMLLYHSNKIKA